MRPRLALWLLIPEACAPRWLDESYRPQARIEAIRTAAREHGCPVEDVTWRCDATSVETAPDGQLAVYEDGGAVGTLVDHAPVWEFELDVCGHLRRYRRVPERGFVEQPPACEGGICEGAAPACRNVANGAWWAIEAAGAPEACDDAPIDDGLSIAVDRGYLTVDITAGQNARWLSGNCRAPTLMVGIDDRWFALCGPGGRTVSRLTAPTTVRSGLLVSGHHEITAVHVAPFDDVRPACERSRTTEIEVSR